MRPPSPPRASRENAWPNWPPSLSPDAGLSSIDFIRATGGQSCPGMILYLLKIKSPILRCHREEGERPPSDHYDGVDLRCSLREPLAVRAVGCFPSASSALSICRTVPQARFASLQDDMAENLRDY